MNGEAARPGRRTSLRSRYRILIVDPSAVPSAADPAELEYWDYAPVYLNSGSAAVTETETRRYDLILVATELADPDAWEVTERIRQGRQGVAPPILGVIDQPHRSTRNRCLAAGMLDTIARPLAPSRVGRLLRKYADHRPVVVVATGEPPAITGIEESLRASGQVLVLCTSSSDELPHVLASGRVSAVVIEPDGAIGARMKELREADPEIADVPLVSCTRALPKYGYAPTAPTPAEILGMLAIALRRVPDLASDSGDSTASASPDRPSAVDQASAVTAISARLPTPESDFPRLRAQLRVWASDCERMCSAEALGGIPALAAEFRAACLPFGLTALAEEAQVLANASARGNLDGTRASLSKIRHGLEDLPPLT